jgi:hypothetical protein
MGQGRIGWFPHCAGTKRIGFLRGSDVDAAAGSVVRTLASDGKAWPPPQRFTA